MSQHLVAIPIQEGEFTKEEHEVTAILVEDDTKDRVLKNSLNDVYVHPYVVKIFNQNGQVEYYRIMKN